MLSLSFLITLCFLYFLGSVFARAYLKWVSYSALRAVRWTLGLALVLHWSWIISLFYQQSRFFPTNPVESHLLLTAGLATLGFVFTFRRSWIFLALVVYPLVIGILVFFRIYTPPEVEMALPTPWLWIHVLLMLAGEVLFLLSASISILYLVADHQLRQRRVSNFAAGLPSLAVLDTSLSEALWSGFLLLSSGMTIGFFFAREFWEVGWLLDPKVLVCVLTWLLYALLLLLRSIRPSFKGRRSAVAACVGFFIVLFLAWGVEAIFPTQHLNYRSSSGAP